MRKIGTGATLFNFFSNNRSLSSSQLYRIDVFVKNEILAIDLYINLMYSKEQVKLSFSGIKKYSFYHTSNWIFYDIEIIKFFQNGEGVYICLDPVDESEHISDDDNDYILCDEVEGFIV